MPCTFDVGLKQLDMMSFFVIGFPSALLQPAGIGAEFSIAASLGSQLPVTAGNSLESHE